VSSAISERNRRGDVTLRDDHVSSGMQLVAVCRSRLSNVLHYSLLFIHFLVRNSKLHHAMSTRHVCMLGEICHPSPRPISLSRVMQAAPGCLLPAVPYLPFVKTPFILHFKHAYFLYLFSM